MAEEWTSPKETEIKTSKLVQLSDCNLENKVLLGGQLLKWMDIVACLAAEKHAKVPCVTASVDDLHIEKSVNCGSVVNMQSRVNRAFNTSMEIEVNTHSEDLRTGETSNICRAFFTFVTQPDSNGKKIVINPITPTTKEEEIQYLLASERKRMRLDYKSTLKEMKKCSFSEEYFLAVQGVKGDAVLPTTTICECVEIVLPQHANHHKTTFGGQLMAWMEATATISAGRLCHKPALLISVDEVFFRAPSKVGDRAVITSMVNNTFDKSLEVGVRVDAYAVGGPKRHIESAYFTFIAPDDKGNPTMLPQMRSENEDVFLFPPYSRHSPRKTNFLNIIFTNASLVPNETACGKGNFSNDFDDVDVELNPNTV
eukprot:gene7088-7888_t